MLQALSLLRVVPRIAALSTLLVGTAPVLAADGAWGATGSMSETRFRHAATRLQDGRVLITGGSGSGLPSDSRIYDPATGTWSVTGSMNAWRFNHAMTLLSTGKVLLADTAGVQLYSPATGTWTAGSSMNVARGIHTATVLSDGRVLVAGGNGVFLQASAEILDPATETWSPTGSLNFARARHFATRLADGRVLVVGGVDSVGTPLQSEIFDPATGLWTNSGSIPRPVVAETGVEQSVLLPTGKVLLVEGSNRTNVLIFDPATGTWSATGSLARPRIAPTVTLLPNGKVLVVGGNALSGVAEVYDAVTGTWSDTGALLTNRRLHSGTLLLNGKLLVAGGTTADTSFASAELYESFASSVTTPTGNNVQNTPVAVLPDGTSQPVQVTFDSVTSEGTTSVTTSPTGAPPPTGFKLGSPPVYYDVTTTATFVGSATICFSWADGQFHNESTLRLQHREGSTWRDVTVSVDTVANVICGQVTSFSPFVLTERAFQFTGFFQPVDNLPTVNAVKAGSAVPVKFSLGTNFGFNIFDPGSPRTQIVGCGSSSTAAIEETVNAGGSTLTYDPATSRYMFVWKSEKSWAGTCRQLLLEFNDGSVQRANFKFQ